MAPFIQRGGTNFEGGAIEFREKLLMYSIETVLNINLCRMGKLELLLNAFTRNKRVANGGFMLLRS